AGLSRQETARRGAALGMAGMGLALAATVALSLARSERPVGVTAALILLVLLVGAAVGTWRARTVEMTQMPELIALLHSFVGAAARSRGGARGARGWRWAGAAGPPGCAAPWSAAAGPASGVSPPPRAGPGGGRGRPRAPSRGFAPFSAPAVRVAGGRRGGRES